MFTLPPRFILSFLLPLTVSAASLPLVLSRAGEVKSESITLPGLNRDHQYSLLYSFNKPGVGDAQVRVEVVQGTRILAARTLHMGDPDWYTQFRVPQAGDAVVRISAPASRGQFSLQVNQWPASQKVKSGPIHAWQAAMPIELGSTVFASGDEAPYIPLDLSARRANAENTGGLDWYRFDFKGAAPKLVFFQIELLDRDQIPVNITVHRMKDGKLEEFYEGEDPVTLPHEVQALPGNKFTPRVLKQPGTYYLSVRASHPEYKLRTRVYDLPPYDDPQKAVGTALDYLLGAGDSWHANTPRRGGLLDRVSAVHQETSLCVACHPTHFTQRAQLYATRNGYPVVQRQQLRFLAERFYNNPRPLYGFEEQGATWSRMISASANVLSRMSHLMALYEDQITGERRENFHRGVAEYLKLYYAGREKLPPDETNGNTPLVSAHEVGWYSWSVTKDPKLPELIAGGEVKNTIDLCYQTLALADIDPVRFKDQIAKNAERILSLQRPDGQWSARFEEKEPAVEFQTGHALWALHAAGIPASHTQVAKSIQFLLKRQQNFGGWMDPLQSFENFRTPFRETQMAVLALSAYFPKSGRAKGWNAQPVRSLSSDPVSLLSELEEIWDAPSPDVVGQIEAASKSNDALIRQAAVEVLGRLGRLPDSALLGDPSKLVQRTAAWATRQAYSRNSKLPTDQLAKALGSRDDRTRWGATRVFDSHFAELARHNELAAPLARVAAGDAVPSIQMAALKGVWQFWFWSADTATRSALEDVVLKQIGKPHHPWVALNLRHAVYNLADENIRYLYNNWVPSIARPEDREQIVKGRLGVESRLATKFAGLLETGSVAAKKELLLALTELPLRRADVYNLDADVSQPGPPVYNRIGNDIEQIAFFGQSAERMSQSLKPLLDSPDPEMRTLASRAVLLVREARFPDVNRIAGPPGGETKAVMEKIEQVAEAKDVLQSLKPASVTAAVKPGGGPRPAKIKLDERYFRGYVQPILEKRGKDGYACVHCHSSHTLFNGTYSTVMNVVDPTQPEKSLLLLKPTSSAESEGVVGANSVAHGGGIRWSKDSPEYITILEWIKGAKE